MNPDPSSSGIDAAPRPTAGPDRALQVISVLGDVDAGTAPYLEAQVVDVAIQDQGDLILDLSRVRSLASTAIPAVIDLLRTVNGTPRNLLLVVGEGSAGRALAASAAAHGFVPHPTLAAAEETLGPAENVSPASIAPGRRAIKRDATLGAAAADSPADGTRPAWQHLDELLVLTHDPRPALHRLTELTCSIMDVADGASIILGSPAEPDLLTSSSSWTQHLDGLQFTTAQGPTLDAFQSRAPVTSVSLPHDPTWPALQDQLTTRYTATERSPRSCAALPIRLRPHERPDDVLGVLTVYSLTPDRLALRPAEHLLRRLASRAAGIVATAHRIREVVTTQEQLKRALTSRAVIDQAKGMVMRDLGCTADEAFARLRQTSNKTNRKLSDIATDIVNGGRP